jgi:hypothetical protein
LSLLGFRDGVTLNSLNASFPAVSGEMADTHLSARRVTSIAKDAIVGFPL